MDGLEVFAPAPHVVRVGGRDVALLPLRLRQYTGFVRAIQPALPLLVSGDVLGACIEQEEAMIKAVSVASGVPPDDLGNLWPHEFVALAGAVVEVNADFFLNRVLPAVRKTTAQIAALAAGDGPSSLPGSDAEATA